MYIGNDLQIAHPSYKIIDDISSSFNGSTTSFALQVNGQTPVPFPISTQQVMISVNGVVQEPDPSGSAGFKLLGSNIVFSSAPANGHAFFGVINAGADYVTAGSEFPDGSITSPSFTFQDDQDTGWFRSGSGSVSYSSNGVQILDFDGNGLNLPDNKKLQIGSGSDLQIYHTGSHSYIDENGTGILAIRTNGTEIAITTVSGESMGRFINDGAVELYYDNSKKFETTSTGITVTGNVAPSGGNLTLMDSSAGGNGRATFGGGDDLQIYHDGSNSYIDDDGTGNLYIRGSASIELRKAGGTEKMLYAEPDAAVELYYDNVKKLETIANGVQTNGSHFVMDGDGANGNPKFACGNGADLNIYHNGSSSYISNSTGNLILESDSYIWLGSKTGTETYLKGIKDGAVELYYDGSKQCETNSGGMNWADGKRAYFGNSSDLQIYHDGTNCIIDSNTGDFLIRNLSGSGAIYLDARIGERGIKVIADGAVELYHDGSKKLETTSYGAFVNGRLSLDDNDKITLGDSMDLQIYHDGSNSYISDQGTGELRLLADIFHVKNAADNETLILGGQNGAVKLYYDNSKKLETTNTGVTVTGTVSDSKGNLRSIPYQDETGSTHTLIAADAGKTVGANNGVTIPANVLGAGDAVTILCHSGSDITLTSGSGLTLYNTADASTGNRTLAARGIATIYFVSSTIAYISGAGLS